VCFFTKLDLRSVYHQVWMWLEDVHKTASATFQALMNDVMCTYLRSFVLVFFDDILIYSTTWTNHLRYLRVVLDTLR
jgi:hypothetical protein